MSAGTVPDVSLDKDWEKFKVDFSKKYATENEEKLRRVIWENNLEIITKHNKDADAGVFTYTLGMNKYGDMTNEEFNKVMNRLQVNRTLKGDQMRIPEGLSLTDLPDTVDWRQKGYVTPVKDQGGCGSCYAFSATGALEGQHFKKTGKLIPLSEQNIIDCSYPQGDNGCYGGFPHWAFNYVKENKGVAMEKVYPYRGVERLFCRFHKIDRLFIGATATGYLNIPSRNETALQVAVATVGPISVSVDAAWTSFQLYKSGIYNEPNCSTSEMNHAMLAIGYGTNENGSYWLVKNSWGTSWGMSGYILMSRNKDNQCGISTMASYPTM